MPTKQPLTDHLYTYQATLVDLHDGDTLTVSIDLGFEVSVIKQLRINGIDAPELKTPAGKLAQGFAASLFAGVTSFVVKTTKDKTEKYGRYLADVFLPGKDKPFSVLMIEANQAVAYNGGKKA